MRQQEESDDDYLARLQKEKKKIKRDIYIWTKDFIATNLRQPGKEDREKVAGMMFRAYRVVRSLFFFVLLYCIKYIYTVLYAAATALRLVTELCDETCQH